MYSSGNTFMKHFVDILAKSCTRMNTPVIKAMNMHDAWENTGGWRCSGCGCSSRLAGGLDKSNKPNDGVRGFETEILRRFIVVVVQSGGHFYEDQRHSVY